MNNPLSPLYRLQAATHLLFSNLPMLRAVIGRPWEDRLQANGRHMGGNEKQYGVGWDVEIKVYQTMHQEPNTSDQPRQIQDRRERTSRFRQSLHGVDQNYAEKQRAAKSSYEPCLCERLEIVIVRMIYHFAVVKRIVGWENHFESSQTGSDDRVG